MRRKRKRRKIENKNEELKMRSKIFFKECQLRLEEIELNKNNKKEKKEVKNKKNLKFSIIGLLFNDNLKGIRKLYNEIMGTKPEKITKNKFLEFVKKVLKGEKITDTEIKELFAFFCKKNRKEMKTLKSKKFKVKFKFF